ncbi:MAG: type III secretion system gatekeeper subunit SctW [Desulfovibrio sp.]|nr:type III secretion system gatekeeper subunit SctW [Desulfovibrio sp.]
MINEVSQHMQTPTSFTAHTAVPQENGKLIGKAVVQVITPQSILEDAMEELSFVFNKSKDYALKNRKERDQAENLKNRMKAYRKMAETGMQDSLNQLLSSIERNPNPDAIIHDALEQHKEPADAWAALDLAREELAKQGASKEVLQAMDEAIVQLDMRYGAAIRAGVCGTLTAAQDYVSLGLPQDSGATYRKAVLEFQKVSDLYTFISEKYGNNVEKAIDFLYSSLAKDLACDTPSTGQADLERVNNNFGRLRSFQSAHELCSKQMDRWEKTHGVTDHAMTSLDLLGKILNLGQQNFVNSSQVHAIAQDAKAPDLEHRIFFLQELQNNVRSFSPLVFDAEEGRSRVLDAVQTAVDEVVAEEDALLAAQE